MSDNELQSAYLDKFGKVKSELLQEWLVMSSQEMIETCRELKLPVALKSSDNMQALFGYLNQFEAEFATEAEKQKMTDTAD